MLRDRKYMKSMNTFGHLALSKNMPLYTRATLKNSSNNNFSRNNFINNEISNISKNNFNLLSRVYSKNKYRGVLDTTSPNNKDIFIDSDSEGPMKKTSKNTEKKNIIDKNGCAKLVIEKVESQDPIHNNEYYKFTNQKPKDFEINPNLLPKSFSNKNLLLRYSSKTQNNKNSRRNNSNNNYLMQSQQLKRFKNRQPFIKYQILNNDTLGRSNKHGSTSNLFDTDSYYFNTSNNLYDSDYLFRTQKGLNNLHKKKGITQISRSPYYLKTSNGTLHKDSSLGKNYIIYTNDSNGFNSYNQDFTISNNIDNTTYQYLYINTDGNQRYLTNEPKNGTLYDSYRNLAKMKTFGKLSMYNNSYNSKIINSFQRYKDKIVKIQSIWRGAYVRELMTFYLNINKFKIIIDKVIKCHLYDYFICLIDIVTKGNKNHFKKNSADRIFVNQRYKYSKYKEKDKNREKENKRLDEYKQALSQKEADYQNILQNYNSLVTELQNIINSNEENNTIDKNNLKDILKNHKFKNILKKFDIISPEQKDKFYLTKGDNDIKNEKLKTMNDNNQSITNHFISNLKIINNEQILLDNSEANKSITKENIFDKNEGEKKRDLEYKDTINKEIISQFMIENKYKDNDKNKPQNYQERNIIICQNEIFTLDGKANPQLYSNNLNNMNGNNIIDNNKQGFSYIQKEEKETIPNDNKNMNRKNYNLTNEIEKEYSLEINSIIMKKTKNNEKDILITHENIFEVLYKDNSIFTEKAKKNMMKIILPIRLKITLREFIHRSIFSLLINILKKSSDEHLEKNDSANIKEFIKEEREKARSIKSSFYNKYHVEQVKKKELHKFLADYAIYKWNKLLYEIAKEIINNKNIILKK